MLKKIFLGILLFSSVLLADKITVFAASDLKFALDDIKKEFLEKYPNNQVNIVYGSSGKGMHQVEFGAPYDIYFSANMDFVEILHKKGHIITTPELYAIGRIVIWSKNKHFNPIKGFDNFNEDWAKRIAIANPSHAPYGEKAKQSMESMNIYNQIKSKLIYGENISATAAYIHTQAADLGIIALSLALAPNIAKSEYSSYYLIDDKLHQPLRQGYGITKYGSKSELAKNFYDFIQTDNSQSIMKKYGFIK